jgi:hypothetical protein
MSEQITYEGMMALFRETREQLKESRRDFSERLKESTAKANREMEALRQQMKRTDKKIGELTGSMGRVIERMVAGLNIIKQFQDLGYIIESHSRNKTFGDALPKDMRGEIDLFLENGDIAIVIEVKTTFKENDVGYLLNVIEKFRRYADFKGDKRRFMGAVAGAVIEEEAIKRAHENGFYVIAQSGKAMEILPTPEGFQAKEW